SAALSAPRSTPAPVPRPAVAAGGPATGRTATGLPQRRRKDRATLPDAPPAAEPQSAQDPGPGMWLEAFHSGLSGASGQDAQGAQDASGSATKGA
ncbi:ATP-binding protein, partial [Streptomyces sp. NPDC091259]